MSRDKLIQALKNMGVTVHGTTEDFDGSKGGIWVSMECGLLAHYPMRYSAEAIDAFYESKVNKTIESAGYFLEQYDGGTAMIYES